MYVNFINGIFLTTGLLIIRGIFGDKFAEKTADFAGILREFSGQIFAEKQRRKPRRKIPEKKRYIGRMSNSGQERKHKSLSNTVLKAIVLVSSYKKNISCTETPGRSLVLLCSLQGKIVRDRRFKSICEVKTLLCLAHVLHVRLNMCLHYYRQQFPFPIRIVSPKSLLISCAQFFATLI